MDSDRKEDPNTIYRGGAGMNALLNYPGAKWGMAPEIVALMPPHRSYLEPFFGSGAVLSCSDNQRDTIFQRSIRRCI